MRQEGDVRAVRGETELWFLPVATSDASSRERKKITSYRTHEDHYKENMSRKGKSERHQMLRNQ